MPRYLPKTLAKTLAYIGYYHPDEYGLFWDSDGTMPWREFLWALQQDPELRFVRESHIRELHYLGLELPFQLDGKKLRLGSTAALPTYPVVVPPDRLFYGCPRKSYRYAQQHGLHSAARSYLVLAVQCGFAEQLAKRRDKTPIMLEILSQEAHKDGIEFKQAGPGLFLTERLNPKHIVFPPISEEKLMRLTSKPKKTQSQSGLDTIPQPGSFIVWPEMYQGAGSVAQAHLEESGTKRRQKTGWKRERRQLRDKRRI